MKNIDIKKVHGLGLKMKSLNEVKCECGSKDLSTGYFIEADEFHITCNSCAKDATGRSYAAASSRLSLLNVLGPEKTDPNCIINQL